MTPAELRACPTCGHLRPETSGERINRAAYLRSQRISLEEQIKQLEKQSRRTPPRTLIEERRKVDMARFLLPTVRERLAVVEYELWGLTHEG